MLQDGLNLYNGPGGRSDYKTDLSGVAGISGVKSQRSMFLAGVFLGPALERQSPPTKTHTLTPEVGQVFYVGNGQGGDGPLEFEVPDDATRLFLGIADGYNFVGKPSYYGDNAGSFTATFEFARDTRRLDATFKVLAKKELIESKKNDFLADAYLGGAGRVVNVFKERGEGRGALSLTLVWLERDDGHVVLRPAGLWKYDAKERLVQGLAQVVKSDEPKCKKGDVVAVRLRQGNDVAVVRLGGCAGIRRELIWRDPASTLAVAVKEVRIKR